MMTSDAALRIYSSLAERRVVSLADLAAAEEAAVARGLELQDVLLDEYNADRREMLKALSDHYGCPFIEYDERLPVPAGLLEGLNAERLVIAGWFPLIRDGETVVVAASNPHDAALREEVTTQFPGMRYEIWVALARDIQWFIQDFLHAPVGRLIGTERTGLAFWRNTMAHWRTRLACYRTDLAKARTGLAVLRWGLGLVALADGLFRMPRPGLPHQVPHAMMISGFLLGAGGLAVYLGVRRARMRPPGHLTLVEVTAATVQFLEQYHYIDGTATQVTKRTMLGRLSDLLYGHSTILHPVPASKERTQLARERNVLAAQRTIAACYRTIYARARTGLAFIRTGVSFAGLGIGLVTFFGLGVYTILDLLLAAGGVGMAADGLLWYLPVRREQAEVPRCVLPDGVRE